MFLLQSVPFLLAAFFLYVLPALWLYPFLYKQLDLGDYTFLEKFVLVFVLSMVINTLIGFTFSAVGILNYVSLILFYLLYSVVMGCLIRQQGGDMSFLPWIKEFLTKRKIKINKTTRWQITTCIFALILAIWVASFSSFPITWDRGRQFAYAFHIVLRGQITKYRPGTFYKPYYFHGFMVGVSVFLILFLSLGSWVYGNLAIFSALLRCSIAFKFYAILLMISPILLTSFMVRRLTDHDKFAKISTICALGFIWPFISEGSLSGVFGFCILPLIIILLWDSKVQIQRDWRMLSLFALVVSTVFLTYSYVIVITTLFSLFSLALLIYRRDYKLVKRVSLMLTIGISFALFLLYINHNMLLGIWQAFSRKKAVGHTALGPQGAHYPLYSYPFFRDHVLYTFLPAFLDYVVFSALSFLFFLWPFSGMLTRKEEKINMRSLKIYLYLLLAFSWFPIRPMVHKQWILFYSVSILSAVGFHTLKKIVERLSSSFNFPSTLKKYDLRKTFFTLLLPAILFLGAFNSFNEISEESRSRLQSFTNTKDVIALHRWTKNHTKKNVTMVYPSTSPGAYLLYDLFKERQVLFSDARYIDIPVQAKLARLYDVHRSGGVNYTFKDVSMEERIEMIEKYSIDLIISFGGKTFNVSKYQSYFSLQTFHCAIYEIHVLYPPILR